MRRAAAFLAFLSIIFTLFSCNKSPDVKNTVYYSYFDTVTVIYDYSGDSAAEFGRVCTALEERLEYYHTLFDIYNVSSDTKNLAYVNSMAGQGAIAVDGALIDLLEYSKQMYYVTDGYVNIAMGAVLSLWHACRTEATDNPDGAKIPSADELSAAAEHCDIDDLIIDRENSTVELRDPEMSLDVGAIAKGYAAERLAQMLHDMGKTGYALDVGKNLRVVGTKPNGDGWQTGIQNPLSDGYAHTFTLSDSAAVTSGGYERYYTVDGKKYHHIIDKDTLMPAEHFASVSIICPDSGLADALSTALFCMDYSNGLEIIKSLNGVGAIWIYNDGRMEKYNI